MRIGIVTPFMVPNYGTKLQAYAISAYMASANDGTVEILNYSPSSDRRLKTVIRKVFSPNRNIARINSFLSRKIIQKTVDPKLIKDRKNAINSFNREYCLSTPIKGYSDLKKRAGDYDCLICGSDQIWLPGNLKDNYYTLEFCGKKHIKKGSYAASLGVEYIREKDKNGYEKFLRNLDFISVREDVGRDLLKNIFDEKPIAWVCDPTFLLSKQEWESLEKKPSLDGMEDGFIFCYFLGTDESSRKAVYRYAQNKGLKIFTVANFKGYCESDTTLSDVQLYDLSVNEFLYLIHHAAMVCTDSMHASIFSIIYESDFVTFERFKKEDNNSRNSRIYSLLKVMGLEKRLLEAGKDIPEDKIDFAEVVDRKDAYIRASVDFINREIM